MVKNKFLGSEIMGDNEQATEKREMNNKHITLSKAFDQSAVIVTAIVIACIYLFNSVARYLLYGCGGFLYYIRFYSVISMLLVLILHFFYTFRLKGDNVVKAELKSFFSKTQIVLSVLTVLILVSCLINDIVSNENLLLKNQEHVLDVMVSIFIFFPLGRYFSGNRIPQRLVVFLKLSLATLTIFMVIILILIYSGTNLMYGFESGVGMQYYRRRLSINSNPNTVGAYSGMIFLICVFMSIKKKKIARFLYIAASFIHFCILIYSNSRGAFVAVLSSLFLIFGLIYYYGIYGLLEKNKQGDIQQYKNDINLGIKRKIDYKKLFISSLCGILSIIALLILRYILLKIYDVFVSSGGTVVRDLDITYTSGRGKIWKASLELVLLNAKNFICGVSPANVESEIDTYMNFGQGIYTHNQFLEIFVSCGIIALVSYIVFLIRIAIDSLKIAVLQVPKWNFESSADNIRRFNIYDDSWIKKVLPTIILYLVVFDLTEACLLYYGFMIGYVFFLLCGWCSEYAPKY